MAVFVTNTSPPCSGEAGAVSFSACQCPSGYWRGVEVLNHSGSNVTVSSTEVRGGFDFLYLYALLVVLYVVHCCISNINSNSIV